MHGSLRFLASGCAVLLFSTAQQGLAFSLGVRAGAGLELLTLTGIKLIQTAENKQITTDEDIQRSPFHFGLDLVVTPVQMGALGVSALVGFRSTSAKVDGPFNDERQFSYLPIGASVDYSLGALRFSGLGIYDLAMSPKLTVSSASTNTKAELEVKGLSRLRFGALAEYFILKNLSVYASGELVTGSFENSEGSFAVQDNEKNPLDVTVSAVKNKMSGFSIGGGVAYTYALSTPAEEPKIKKSSGKKKRKKSRARKKKK